MKAVDKVLVTKAIRGWKSRFLRARSTNRITSQNREIRINCQKKKDLFEQIIKANALPHMLVTMLYIIKFCIIAFKVSENCRKRCSSFGRVRNTRAFADDAFKILNVSGISRLNAMLFWVNQKLHPTHIREKWSQSTAFHILWKYRESSKSRTAVKISAKILCYWRIEVTNLKFYPKKTSSAWFNTLYRFSSLSNNFFSRVLWNHLEDAVWLSLITYFVHVVRDHKECMQVRICILQNHSFNSRFCSHQKFPSSN